jgi:DNA-binding Lrp family transcriptional regulator
MKEEGTIKQCTVLVDGHKLGDEGTAFLMLSCASEVNKKDVLESLKLIPDLYMIVDVIGDYDFFTWARLENIEKLARLVGSIRSLGNIDRVETILLTQTYFAFSLAPTVAIKCNGMDLPRKP